MPNMNLLIHLDIHLPSKLLEGLTQRLRAETFCLPLNEAQQKKLVQAQYVFYLDKHLHKGLPKALHSLPAGQYAFTAIALQENTAFPPAFDAIGYWALEKELDYICQAKISLENWPEQLPRLIQLIQRQQQRYEAPFPKIELPRSVLRKPQLKDAPDFLELHSNLAINRYVPKTPLPNLAQAERILRQSWQDYQLWQGITWLAEDRQRQCLIGGIGFTNWLPEQHSAEFGGRLFPNYWGSNRALQASQAVIDFGFQQMGLHRIEAQMLSQNSSAIRIAKMLGFQQEGLLKGKISNQQHFYDVEIWSLFCE